MVPPGSRARRLEAVWTNQFWTSCRTKSQDQQKAQERQDEGPQSCCGRNKLVKLARLLRLRHALVELDACRTGPLSGEDPATSLRSWPTLL